MPSFLIQVTLDEHQIATLCALTDKPIDGYTPIEVVGGVAQGLLTDAADGALVLEPQIAARVRPLLGDDGDLGEIVKALEARAGKDGDHTVITTRIDPFYQQSAEQAAQMRGLSVQAWFQEFVDWAMDQGWPFGTEPPESRRIRLTPQDWAYLEEATGKVPLTGADIVEYVKSLTEPPEFVAAEHPNSDAVAAQ